MLPDGTYDGVVTGAKWYAYEKDGDEVMYLSIPVNIAKTDGSSERVSVSLFFRNEIIQRGVDQGKSQVEANLEKLASYGLEIDPGNPSSLNPQELPEMLEGAKVSVYLKTNDEGKQNSYLNKGSRPALEDDKVSSMWADVTGGAAKAPAAEKHSEEYNSLGIGDDDDLPF